MATPPRYTGPLFRVQARFAPASQIPPIDRTGPALTYEDAHHRLDEFIALAGRAATDHLLETRVELVRRAQES